MSVYRVDGRPFETSDIADLNTWHNKLNITWRSIGDDRVALWTHLVRTATDPVLGGECPSCGRPLPHLHADAVGPSAGGGAPPAA